MEDLIKGVFSQTVTLYRLREGQVQRWVSTRAYMEMEDQLTVDEHGCRQKRKFVLSLSGQDGPLEPGDRVYRGNGPEITAQDWDQFIPALVEGLGEVRYVKPYYWRDVLCLTEAGQK